MKQIKKIINGNQIEIKVYSGKRSRSESDREMDERADTVAFLDERRRTAV